jgi:1-acyl-sn-glycerol-3-phosphate acyltransferase
MTANKIKKNKLSVWMFPEGTRSRGRGLLPLKTGAFRTAIQAKVPVVPVCASNQHGTIKLNRWDNGKIIIEFLDPINLDDSNRENLRTTVNDVHTLMSNKIEELSAEAVNYLNK